MKRPRFAVCAAGKVQILNSNQIGSKWDSTTGDEVTVCECCQRLIRELEQGSEQEAAHLHWKIGSRDAEAEKDFPCFRYDNCTDKRQTFREAASPYGLFPVWMELARRTAAIDDTIGGLQNASRKWRHEL